MNAGADRSAVFESLQLRRMHRSARDRRRLDFDLDISLPDQHACVVVDADGDPLDGDAAQIARSSRMSSSVVSRSSIGR